MSGTSRTRSQTRSARSLALSLFAGLMIVAQPALTDVIPSGIDVWHTPSGTGTKIEVPASFISPGCPSVKTSVDAHGAPIVTQPSGVLEDSDTVLYRPNAVSVARGGSNSTGLRVVALNLAGDSAVSLPGCSGTWTVTANLGNRSQPTGTINIGLTSSGVGGTYTASFNVNPVVTVESGPTTVTGNGPTVPISTASSSDWAPNPGDGGVEGDPNLVDTNGDGVADTNFPGGTHDFAPGWLCNLVGDPTCTGPVVSAPEHTGPHGVEPKPPPDGC